jgi:hypothetical protein
MPKHRERRIGTYDVPFIDGQMMEYDGYSYGRTVERRPNTPFKAIMTLNGHWRGRSSARVGLKDTATGDRYSTGFAAFYDMVAEGRVADSKVSGTWQVKKQGANYILIRLGD